VELAPTFLPPRLDKLHGRAVELGAQSLCPFGVRVDGESMLGLLEALGMEVEQPGSCFLELLGWNRERDPAELARAQRNALFSFSKNPSSVL
jgi:hypothetical protein